MSGRFFSVFIVFVVLLTAACTSGGGLKDRGGAVPATSQGGDSIAAEPPAIRVDTFVVALTGDIMMGTTYPDSALPRDCGAALFADVGGILRRADIAAGNLEGALCDTSVAANKRKSEHSYLFRTPVEFAPRLKEAGYDFLSMANNHALDFGYDGVRSTEESLDMAGIKYAGLRGRSECAVVERRGIRFGLCAFGHNYYTLRHSELWKVKEILDSLCSMADVVIVSFHGGGEGKAFSHLPYEEEMFLGEKRGSLRSFARYCIDNGADIVFGHGPHVVRAVEMYKGRLIAYSLGNFCTPYGVSISGVSGYAPVIEAVTDRRGRFIKGRIYPFVQRRGLGPRRDTTGVVVKRIMELTAADIPGGKLEIRPDGEIRRK